MLDGPSTGAVDWKIVTGAGGPALGDFTSWTGVGPPGKFTNATGGVLNFNTSGNQFASIRLNITPQANEPKNESFMIELSDPSTHTVLGSAERSHRQLRQSGGGRNNGNQQHPVAEHEHWPSLDLGNEREQRREGGGACERQSRA